MTQHYRSYPRIADHIGHRWERLLPSIGRSVGCADCGVRLYQGVCYNTPKGQAKLANALDALRDYITANPEMFAGIGN